MKEKRLLLLVFTFLFLLLIAFLSVNVSAVENETLKVDNAYYWLTSKVSTWPSGDEGAYALMVLAYDDILGQKGKNALLAGSKNSGECWPSPTCNVKSTALAMIGLNLVGFDTMKAENSLLTHKRSFIDTSSQWYLQIDADGDAKCSIYYKDHIYPFNLSSNKILSPSSVGSCLMSSSATQLYGYQISTSPSLDCAGETYLVQCDKDFYVSMIYTQNNLIYVPANTQSGSANSRVEAKVQTVCLADSGSSSSCNYEGTAWAAYALLLKSRDVSMFVPYLIGYAAKNAEKMPDAFLYILTSDSAYADKLLKTQYPDGHWMISTDTTSDTAIAMLALKDYNADTKDKAKTYLLNHQLTDGSFGSITKTALVLYSLWPKAVSPVTAINECEQRGYFCRSMCDVGEEEETQYGIACGLNKCCGVKEEITCAFEGYECCEKCASGHQPGYDLTCSGLLCCTQCETEQSCYDVGGTICDADQQCTITSQRTPEGDCCLGDCETATKSCSSLGGTICEGSCSVPIQGTIEGKCCVGDCKKGSLWWLFVILILAIAGVVVFYLQKKGIIKFGKFGKGEKKPGFPGMPPGQQQPQQKPSVSSRPAVRPILPWPQPQPQFQRPQSQQPQRAKKPDEFEETFKKLKEMQ